MAPARGPSRPRELTAALLGRRYNVLKSPMNFNDEIGLSMTIFGLSWDHRALDGVLAAQFLASLRRHVEAWDGG